MAHDVGFSTVEVQVGDQYLTVEMVFAVKDVETLFELDTNSDGRITEAEFAASEVAINRYFSAACVVQADGTNVQPSAVRSSIDTANNVDVTMIFPATRFQRTEIRFNVIVDLPPGHRLFARVTNPAGKCIEEKLLNRDAPNLDIIPDSATAAPSSSPLQSFLGFLKLGVEHIGTGYDHLLFLFGLLIVTRGFRASLLVITCFTLAHSVTLAAATFNLVNLPARITEPLIAATIVYVGVENILRHGDPHGRWMLTFGFGLVHGFGFASVLREMGVGGRAGGVAMPLFAFNLGVELGQIAIAAILLPFIWKLRKRPMFVRRVVPLCSAGVALLGSYWLIERLW